MKPIAATRPKPAYIFGGMEAFILQGLVGGLLGGALVIKGYWRRIKAFFSATPEEKAPPFPVEPEQPDDAR